MRKILTLLVIAICWISCSNNDENSDRPPSKETPTDNSQEDSVIYKITMEVEISDATPVNIEVKGKGNKKANLEINWGDGQTSKDTFSINKQHEYSKIGKYSITITGNDITTLVTSGPITSVDLTQSLCIEKISIWYSYLKYIDISNNPNLSDFTCQGGLLTSLDISNNYKLRYLDCCANKLTSLDFTNNTTLKDIRIAANPFNSETMNSIFRTLPLVYDNSAKIYIDKDLQCDISIAINRGWQVSNF